MLYLGQPWNLGGVLIMQGGMAIHFFAILSGYLLANSCWKYNGSASVVGSTFKYTLKKVKRFVPYSCIALLVACFVRIRAGVLYNNYSLVDIFRWLDGTWSEWLMLNAVFPSNAANGPTWFFSALLIDGFLLFGVLYFFNKFSRKLSYLVVLFITICCYLNYYEGHFMQEQLQRVLNGLGIGIICYGITDRLTGYKFIYSIFAKIIFSIIEVFCIIGIGYFLYFKITTWTITFQCLDLFFAVLICCNAIHNTVLSNALETKFSEWLGSISTGIYFMHSALLVLFYFDIQWRLGNSQLLLWTGALICIIGGGILLEIIVERKYKIF